MTNKVKYVVYVTEPHNYDSLSFEVEFSSLINVTKYVNSLPQRCYGHVTKCIPIIDDIAEYMDEVIMRF
jgi:hypothetical protein